MAADAQKLQDVTGYLHMYWSAPLILIVVLYFLWQELGAAAFAGFGLMVLLAPINMYVGNKQKSLQGAQMKHKDSRIKMMNEILNGIKVCISLRGPGIINCRKWGMLQLIKLH